MVRNAAKTRIRVQDEPLDRPWPNWSVRSGEVPDELVHLAATSSDEVEIERAHQEIWSLLTPLD